MPEVKVSPELMDVDPDFASYVAYCDRFDVTELDSEDEEERW